MQSQISQPISQFKKLSKLLKKADYFGVYLNFQIKDKERYRSIFGGFVFTCFFIFAICYMMVNFQNFVNRTKINLVYNEGILDYAPPFNFKNYTIGFAVGLDTGDPEMIPVLNKYFDVYLNGVSFIKVNNARTKKRVSVVLHPCDYSYFYNLVNNSYNLLTLDNFLCPDLSNFTIQGIYTEDIFNYFEFAVVLKPSFYNKTEEVKKLFVDNEIKATISFIDTSISVYNFDKPVEYFLNNYYSILDWSFYKKINLDFMSLNFVSDSNILFDGEEKKSILVLDTTREFTNDIGEDRFVNKQRDFNIFTKMYLRSSPRNRLIKRVYMKVTEYLANMSSIISSILLILFVIISNINLFKAQQTIMKKILKFKDNFSGKKLESINYMKEVFNKNYEKGILKPLGTLNHKFIDKLNSGNEIHEIKYEINTFSSKDKNNNNFCNFNDNKTFNFNNKNYLKNNINKLEHREHVEEESLSINSELQNCKISSSNSNSSNSNNKIKIKLNNFSSKNSYSGNLDNLSIENHDNSNIKKYLKEVEIKNRDLNTNYKNNNNVFTKNNITITGNTALDENETNNNLIIQNSTNNINILNLNNKFKSLDTKSKNKEDEKLEHPIQNFRSNSKSATNLPNFRRFSRFKIDTDLFNEKVKEKVLTPCHLNFNLEKRNISQNKTKINPYKVKMGYNVCEIIIRKLCSCCSSKKLEIKNLLYEKGYSKFKYHMDIMTYIRKMHEIDIIKYLILDDNQINLFNFLSKPSISLVGKNELIESISRRFNVDINKNEIDRINDSFNKLSTDQNISEINKKLLPMVASEIDSLITDYN